MAIAWQCVLKSGSIDLVFQTKFFFLKVAPGLLVLPVSTGTLESVRDFPQEKSPAILIGIMLALYLRFERNNIFTILRLLINMV